MSVQSVLTQAEALFEAGELEEAKQLLLKAHDSKKQDKEVLNNLGAIAYVQKDYTEAQSYFLAALNIDPTYRDAATNYAQLLQDTGQADIARELLQAVEAASSTPKPDNQGESTKNLADHSEILIDSAKAEKDRIKKLIQVPKEALSPDVIRRCEILHEHVNQQLRFGLIDEAVVNLMRLNYMTRFTDQVALQQLTEIYKLRGCIPEIKELWKRVAICAFERDELDIFLETSYRSIYAEQFYATNSNYQHATVDWDLNTVSRFAAKNLPINRWIRKNRKHKKRSKNKLRVGFVLEGLSTSQAPTRSYLPIAEHHDRSQFELFFYSRWSHSVPLAQNQEYDKFEASLISWNCEVRHPKEPLSRANELDFLAKSIVSDNIDILVFQTTYFVPVYNVLANLNLAPVQAAVAHQQSEFHTEIDLVFTSTKKRMEMACDTGEGVICHTKSPGTPITKSQLGVPEDAILVTSAARDSKYSQPEFWTQLSELMGKCPELWFLAIGLDSLLRFENLPDQIQKRIITPGFRNDVLELFGAADIFVDLFPAGSGSAVMEAIQCGLPVVCFESENNTLFKPSQETVSSTWVEDSDLIIAQKDYAQWQKTCMQLVSNTDFRTEKAERMKENSKKYYPEMLAKRFLNTLAQTYRNKVK